MIDKPGLQHETVWELYLRAPDQGNVPRHHMYPSSESGLLQHPHLVGTLDDQVTKMQTSTWKSLHLEPVTSFVCGLSPLPMSHSLASQGKMALQNFEPVEVAK
jgi:hypothetical protein